MNFSKKLYYSLINYFKSKKSHKFLLYTIDILTEMILKMAKYIKYVEIYYASINSSIYKIKPGIF